MARNRLLDLMAKSLLCQHQETVCWVRVERAKQPHLGGMSDAESAAREEAVRWRDAGEHHRAMFVAQLSYQLSASPEALVDVDLSEYLLGVKG